LNNNTNIIDHFDQYFEMVPAISDELKFEVYKLRYQVYCIENKFENCAQYPDGLEFDDYDQRSVHYLIRHRKSGDYAATTRLILPDANNPEKLFPLEQYCMIDNVAVMQSINRAHLAEISRFCVSKAFKKRKNEAHSLAAIGSDWQLYTNPDERRTFPHLSLALVACVIKASYENNIHYIYAASQPPWLRFVSAVGINLIKIGPLTDYHGDRWPTVIKIADMLDYVAEKKPDIWNLLTNKGRFLQAQSFIENRATLRPKVKVVG
jgi:N-acyl amino acid synthase of PEP-CTERM/exosortase system